jgi:hypothetical protein
MGLAPWCQLIKSMMESVFATIVLLDFIITTIFRWNIYIYIYNIQMNIFAKLTTDSLLEHWFFFYAVMPVMESSQGYAG